MTSSPSDEGRRLAATLDAVTRIHLDVSALLETAVGLLQADGFEVGTDTLCIDHVVPL